MVQFKQIRMRPICPAACVSIPKWCNQTKLILLREKIGNEFQFLYGAIQTRLGAVSNLLAS